MGAYCAEIRKLEKHFQGLEILHVLRDSNIAADVLAKLGSNRVKVLTQNVTHCASHTASRKAWLQSDSRVPRDPEACQSV